MSTPANTARPKKVALLTAGGLAPCLSSAVAGLIERYTEIAPEIEIAIPFRLTFLSRAAFVRRS